MSLSSPHLRGSSSSLRARVLAVVAEQMPLSADVVAAAFDRAGGAGSASSAGGEDGPIDLPHFRESLRQLLTARTRKAATALASTEITPGVSAEVRLAQGAEALIALCDQCLAREAIATSLTDDERREILRGMILTRAVDSRLKQFFAASEVRYQGTPFQGKGFRSLGQEAIYAA